MIKKSLDCYETNGFSNCAKITKGGLIHFSSDGDKPTHRFFLSSDFSQVTTNDRNTNALNYNIKENNKPEA